MGNQYRRWNSKIFTTAIVFIRTNFESSQWIDHVNDLEHFDFRYCQFWGILLSYLPLTKFLRYIRLETPLSKLGNDGYFEWYHHRTSFCCISFSITKEQWNICHYSIEFVVVVGYTLCCVSILTMASISADRLLAFVVRDEVQTSCN